MPLPHLKPWSLLGLFGLPTFIYRKPYRAGSTWCQPRHPALVAPSISNHSPASPQGRKPVIRLQRSVASIARRPLLVIEDHLARLEGSERHRRGPSEGLWR
jgi:hypothetical protein